MIENLMNATSSSNNLESSIDQPCSSIILSVYFLNSSKMLIYLFTLWMSLEVAYQESQSIKLIKIVLISTSWLSFVVASSKESRVLRWNSSGKAWMIHSIRYYCDIVSLHPTIVSSIFGKTWVKYIFSSTDSNWLNQEMLSPTVLLSSSLSASQPALSFLEF